MIVKYSKKFPYAPFLNEDIGFELEIADNDDPLEALATLKKYAEKFHKDNNPQLQETPLQSSSSIPEVQVSSNPSDESVSLIICDIQNTHDITKKNSYGAEIGIMAYSHITEPRIKEAFEKRLKELQNKQP